MRATSVVDLRQRHAAEQRNPLLQRLLENELPLASRVR